VTLPSPTEELPLLDPWRLRAGFCHETLGDAQVGYRRAPMEWTRDGYVISTDRSRIDRAAVHEFLARSYWAPGISRELVDRSIDESLCFGLYAPDGSQAGFARAVTDRATCAYLADVFVLEPHRGRGLGLWLVQTVVAHPDLESLRRFLLFTADAHELYRRAGFGPAQTPDWYMELVRDPGELYGKQG
jgi:GNAT superfamily N-acetyltransferase